MEDGSLPSRGLTPHQAGPGQPDEVPGPRDGRPTPDADESSAATARSRYRAEGVVPVAPDARIVQLLEPGESLLAVHAATVADSRAGADGSSVPPGASGDLYLTSDRLVFAGGVLVTYPLGDIEEAVIAGEDVLLVMRDGVGLRVAVEEPRLLRVQIAAARAARRGQVSSRMTATERAPQAPSR